MFKSIVIAAAALGAASPAAAATLTNGSFEQGTNPGSFTTLARGSTAITGWTVDNTVGGIDYIGNYWQAAGGNRSIDLSGSARGGIYQDVSTVIGQVYRVTFFIAGNPDGAPLTKQLAVSINGADAETFAFTNSAATTRANMGWQQQTYEFMATSTTSRLTFATSERVVNGQSSPYGPALDNVSIFGVVPEPATWAMMLVGFGMVGFGLRRRKATVRTAVRFA